MILLGLILGCVATATLQLPDFSATIAEPFQKICLHLSPQQSDFHSLYVATVCGVTPENNQLMWDFRNTGLYHLVVVSGAHLSFLATILLMCPMPSAINKYKKYVLILALVTYSLASGLNPPVVRALVSYFYFQFQKYFRLSWSYFSIALGSGLFCLMIFPKWWLSLSFVMSWMASVAILLPGKPLAKATYCYLILLLPMSQFQWNNPFTILFNFLLAPLLGFLVLPFSILPFVAPPFVFLSDYIWRAVTLIVELSSQIVSTTDPWLHLTLWMNWLFLCALHFFCYRRHVRMRRLEWTNA